MLENFQWVFGDDNCIFGDQLRAGAGFDAVLIKNIQRLYEAAWEVMTRGLRLYENSDHLFFSLWNRLPDRFPDGQAQDERYQ